MSPHATSRRIMRRMTPWQAPRRVPQCGVLVALCAALVWLPGALVAQQRDSAAATRDTVAPRPPDSAVHRTVMLRARIDSGPPISPGKAFLRSFLLPGWGQRTLGRTRATAIFAVVELGSLLMVAETKQRLDFAKRHGADSLFVGFALPPPDGTLPVPIFRNGPLVGFVELRRQQLEDWITIVAFNHLLSGADAFVAAHLWDVPGQFSIVPTRDGTVLALSITF
ncbi:MAG TPA: hypothetical protein VFK13_00080 [Gemmatimonadaceae bacterium]|nr:hypothetical protein [Gemmatimonadaceae bacterium]